MKVLFICKANAERSQIGAEFLNSISKRNIAMSAGVKVKQKEIGFPPGVRISEILLSSGYYNILRRKRKRLTKKMAVNADLIVVILSPKEIRLLPPYLRKMKNVRYWKLGALGKDYHLPMVLKTRVLVERLAKEIAQSGSI